MKLFNLFVVAVSFISTTLAANDYQITWYGCPRNCSSQKNSSCNIPTWPTHSGGTKYFCALSTHFPHYDSYCGKRAVIMLADGQKQMINVKVVDSCSSCPPYHVDLSHTSFGDLLPHIKGEADCIWSIYDENGTRLTGPIYKSLSEATSKLGMSKDQLLSAFDNTAKKMVRNGEYVGKLGSASSGSSSNNTTTRKTTIRPTTTRPTTTTTRRTTTRTTTKKITSKIVISIVNKNPVTTKTVPTTRNVPVSLPSKQTTPVKFVPSSVNSVLPAKETPQQQPQQQPQQPEQDPAGLGMIPVDEIANTTKNVTNEVPKSAPESTLKAAEVPKGVEAPKVNEPEGGSKAGVIAAIGLGCCAATGLGLLFIKRKKSNIYESMKNSNLMRTLSRRR